ncbi:hypothetical protein HWV62_33849 [Athelia sp. TMB]|nr:hypothetical protein HWV62_33849 [Athelia sp. TMB]
MTNCEEWQLIFEFAYAFEFDSLWVAASKNLGRNIDTMDKIRIARRRGNAGLLREGLEEFANSSRGPPSSDSEDAKIIGYDGLCTIMELRIQHSLSISIPVHVVDVPQAETSSPNDHRDMQSKSILSPAETFHDSNQSVITSESITRVDSSTILSSTSTHHLFFAPETLHVRPSLPGMNEERTELVNSSKGLIKDLASKIAEIDDSTEVTVLKPNLPTRSLSSPSIDAATTSPALTPTTVPQPNVAFVDESLAEQPRMTSATSDVNVPPTGKTHAVESKTQTSVMLDPEWTGEKPVEGTATTQPDDHTAPPRAPNSPQNLVSTSMSNGETTTVTIPSTIEAAESHEASINDDLALAASNTEVDMHMDHLPQSTPVDHSAEIHPESTSPLPANAMREEDNFEIVEIKSSDEPEPVFDVTEEGGDITPRVETISAPSSITIVGCASEPANHSPSIPMVNAVNTAVDQRSSLDSGIAEGSADPERLADSIPASDELLPDIHRTLPEIVNAQSIAPPPSPAVEQLDILDSLQPSPPDIDTSGASDVKMDHGVSDGGPAVELGMPHPKMTDSKVTSINNLNDNPAALHHAAMASAQLPSEGPTSSMLLARGGSALSDEIPTVIAENAEESTPEHKLSTREGTKPQDASQHKQSRRVANDQASRVPCNISLAGDDDPRFAGMTPKQKNKKREKEKKRLEKIEREQRLASM